MDTTDRVHALDAVRAYALLLGIVLHACLSFIPGLGALGWPIVDESPSLVLGGVFFVIHLFRMTLFFVIAGYFARVLYHRRGARAFWQDRARRILLPLVLAWPVVMPLIVAAMAWSAHQAGKPLSPPAPRPGTVAPFPLAHLWFLYVLVWLYPLTIAVRSAIRRLPDGGARASAWADAAVARLTTLPFGAFALALPVAAVLFAHHPWNPWEGIPAPDRSLVVGLPALVGYGVAFAFGWLLQRQPAALRAIEARCGLSAAGAVALTAVAMAIAGVAPGTDPDPLTGTQRAVHVLAYGGAGWLWTFALLGGALRWLPQPSPARRYLADASYWLYLMHLPVVFGLQAMVSHWPVHWTIKFPLVTGLTLLVLLPGYHWLVRSTALGGLLNGRRVPGDAAKRAGLGRA